MKADYKNWVPGWMPWVMGAATALTLAGVLLFGMGGLWVSGAFRVVLTIVCLLAFFGCGRFLYWCVAASAAFSYDGKRQLSRQIVEGVAEYVTLPDGGIGLDVGCGSAALTIACAKKNPQGIMLGLDRWGKEYAFSKALCESNSKAEGVSNTRFTKGDAINLSFDDETFDAVISNYVYHDIPADRQTLLLETLRVLKKGGCFAIHDLMSKSKYGDMEALVKKLKDMGYEKVELIDTTDGKFMSKSEARRLMLTDSTLLVGRK